LCILRTLSITINSRLFDIWISYSLSCFNFSCSCFSHVHSINLELNFVILLWYFLTSCFHWQLYFCFSSRLYGLLNHWICCRLHHALSSFIAIFACEYFLWCNWISRNLNLRLRHCPYLSLTIGIRWRFLNLFFLNGHCSSRCWLSELCPSSHIHDSILIIRSRSAFSFLLRLEPFIAVLNH